MFIYNLDLMDDLFNGAGGTIIGVEYNKEQDINCIIVKFDLANCGAKQRERCFAKNEYMRKKYKALNGTPIYRIEHEYQLKTRHGKGMYAQAAKGKLIQFPLRLYYASTAHKLQVRFYLNSISVFKTHRA